MCVCVCVCACVTKCTCIVSFAILFSTCCIGVKISNLHPQETVEKSNVKYRQLAQLSLDFVETVKRYGKIIIAEQSVPDVEKTIPELRVGGVAGGKKYTVAGSTLLVHECRVDDVCVCAL